MGYFCPKYMRFELKKCRRVIFHDTKQWCKIWTNPDLVVPKMAQGLGWTFIRGLKVWNIVRWWALFVKAYNVSARNFQRHYVSRHWTVMQNVQENWLVAWKMTWEIWLIFMRAGKSLKICTLIGSFCLKHKDLDEKLQKYISWQWRMMESLKKNWHFQKWHEEFGEF